MEILKGLRLTCENCGVGSRPSNANFELDYKNYSLQLRCFNCDTILADIDLKSDLIDTNQLRRRFMSLDNSDKLLKLLGATTKK